MPATHEFNLIDEMNRELRKDENFREGMRFFAVPVGAKQPEGYDWEPKEPIGAFTQAAHRAKKNLGLE